MERLLRTLVKQFGQRIEIPAGEVLCWIYKHAEMKGTMAAAHQVLDILVEIKAVERKIGAKIYTVNDSSIPNDEIKIVFTAYD